MSTDPHGNHGKNEHQDEGLVFSARQASQGEIILRTRAPRIIFVAGLVGILILAAVVRFAIG
ncbi:hypothetical protein [Mesorhizobium sp. B2-3-4]|uniref:hypothetical protein n=1 Tax=Mesorhizobium sp. B2-3-4 TaxID=2589959 RepID=UPI001125DA53|nr:hypothetical protein [Mesorhizobium sp. B2-3-4]TPM40676.1 hypothetical protein FJ967_04895 [Mesorhizobium sp. B2-3-4]